MSKKLKWTLIITAGFLVLIALILGIVFSNLKVPVPSVTGKTLTEATSAIQQAGLRVTYSEEFSFTVAKDIVISQDIENGQKLKRGSVVSLCVSAGIEQVAVPQLENDPQELAEKRLNELGFTVTITEEFSDTIEKGLVLSQSVYPDKEADKGSEINIVISKGPDLVEVPALTGKTLEEVREILSLAEFTIKSDIECSDTVPEGLIISQDAQPGDRLKRHSKITVMVSAGTANTVGNTNANSRNWGIAAAQGNWVYYSNTNNNFYLYKMRQDGTEKQILTKDHTCSINVVGEWVYYTNESDGSSLYKIRIDGTKRTKLNSESSYNLHVIDGWVYYIRWGAGNSLCKIKTDGTQKTILSSDACTNVNIENDWLYYTDMSSNFIYKMRTDGTGKSIISENIQGTDLNAADGMLYYTDIYSLEKIKPDGTGWLSYNYPNRQISYINVNNGWIYFLEYDFTSGSDTVLSAICKMRTDGTSKHKIYQQPFTGMANNFINVLGEWIYFPNQEDNGYLYRIKTDGSNLQKLY